MHIKQITISNFRSFRQQPEIQSFSPAANSIIGRNGSGKSNLLDAVQFVLLSPRFATLRQEERQALLHEGSGSAAVNAFVEIVFDNHDHRFALEHSDQVVLRRTIGLKKDEFFLQRKRVTKQQVTSLLEGAGFSRSNPYFMVQQGKIQDFCVMRDPERLGLLQQVAGTTLYDAKKAESLLKMQENADSIEKIDSILADIQDKLDDLESEKQELVLYQRMSKSRRAMEYTLYTKELTKARDLLQSIEDSRSEHVEELSELHQICKDCHAQIRNLEGLLQTKLGPAYQRNRKSLQALQAESKQQLPIVTHHQVQVKELQEAVQQDKEQDSQNQLELQRLEKEMQQVQTELDDQVSPQYNAAAAQLQATTAQRAAAVQQLEGLRAKQGRGQQFTSQEDRDKFLRESIRDIQQNGITQTQETLDSQQAALAALRRSMQQESSQTTKIQSQLDQQLTPGLANLSKQVDAQQQERLELSEARSKAWRASEGLQEDLRLKKEASQRARHDLFKTMPRATALGLEALEQHVVEQEGLKRNVQYFGTVLDNVTLTDAKYGMAVEVAAQNSLFHVIVDNDHTASRLMQRLEREQLGRVTFLPLNRLVTSHNNNNHHKNNQDDLDSAVAGNDNVANLLDLCVRYPKPVHKAMHHVFGRKLLARNTDVASEWSTRYSVDCITLDGDLSSRKGALTGGYLDASKMRLQAHAQYRTARTEFQELTEQNNQQRTELGGMDQQITALQESIQRLQGKHTDLLRSVQSKETEVERLKARGKQQQEKLTHLEEVVIPPLEQQLQSLQGDVKNLETELGTELTETLSAEDQELLRTLKTQVTELAQQMETENAEVDTIGLQKQKLSSRLSEHLQKRVDELQAENKQRGSRRKSYHHHEIDASKHYSHQEQLDEATRLLDAARRVQQDTDERLEAARKAQKELRAEMMSSKNELEELKSKDLKNATRLEEASDKTERLMNKRSMCISKRETYMRKIQELGSLPAPAELEKFSNKSISDLMKSLESVNKKLKKYSHVNKKAYDQYLNFSEQRETLLARKSELDEGAKKVEELVDSLDLQKDEAINRTFRGVSTHFKDVFKELVPNGAGELIMRTAIDEQQDTDNEADSEGDEGVSPKKKKAYDPNNPDVSMYRGVGIKVRFSAVGENYMMSQLSGGQKALVAMALIFAIQRCDPAPFYIFDELDQALDSAYRAAVANVIQRQANSKENPTQFIVSTFRPELVKVANTCYGISLQNKVSNLHHMDKKDALKFIANLMEEEEAVGEVTTVATNKSRLSRKRKSKTTAEQEEESP